MNRARPEPRDLESSTLPPMLSSDLHQVDSDSRRIGLAVLWSRHAPSQVGETLLLPAHAAGSFLFGRGEGSPLEARVTLARWSPGEPASRRVVICPRISRSQLRLTRLGDDRLLVENVGSCALVRDGAEVSRAELAVGDIVVLKNELMFLCISRPAHVHATFACSAVAPHAFGLPDAAGLVGESYAAWELRHRLATIAAQPFHLLLLGPSGTGKELAAQAIHRMSARRARPLVSRNAATIPESIADAELFGNARGYPNPGMPERAGLIGAAHGSTLFLDEMGELPHSLQAHLLRVLDQGEYQRLGESKARQADVRIIAATNRAAAELKHDVLARLTLRLTLPDLNERREDIPLLIAHLLRRYAEKEPQIATRFFTTDAVPMPRVSPALVERLVKHQYTAHVRELDAMLVAAALASSGSYVELAGKPTATSTLLPKERELWLQPAEAERLLRMRQHLFSPTACGKDPAYPGNRQTADLHFRHLACKALASADFRVDAAAALLAGAGNDSLRAKCQERLSTFLANLERRVVTESAEALAGALAEDWRGFVDAVLPVVGALREGRLASLPDQRRQ